MCDCTAEKTKPQQRLRILRSTGTAQELEQGLNNAIQSDAGALVNMRIIESVLPATDRTTLKHVTTFYLTFED